MQPTPTTQSTYNPTDEMKRLLDIVKQQSTYTDITTHIQQLELLTSAVRGQLAALRTKHSAESNKTYSTTAVAKKRLKPKAKAVPKPKLPTKPKLTPQPTISNNTQLQAQTPPTQVIPPQKPYTPNPIGANRKPSTQAFGATNNSINPYIKA